MGKAKAITLLGIADPDIVDEKIVLALSGEAHVKSNFTVGEAKSSFQPGRSRSSFKSGKLKGGM
jgi:hypothetical protein